jgi:nicotinamidase-related amidase
MQKFYGLDVPSDLAESCKPERTALVVYDMQAGVLSQIPGADAIVNNVATLLSAARRRGFRIFFTRHTWLPPETMGVAQLRRAAIWRLLTSDGKFCAPFESGSPEWQNRFASCAAAVRSNHR